MRRGLTTTHEAWNERSIEVKPQPLDWARIGDDLVAELTGIGAWPWESVYVHRREDGSHRVLIRSKRNVAALGRWPDLETAMAGAVEAVTKFQHTDPYEGVLLGDGFGGTTRVRMTVEAVRIDSTV